MVFTYNPNKKWLYNGEEVVPVYDSLTKKIKFFYKKSNFDIVSLDEAEHNIDLDCSCFIKSIIKDHAQTYLLKLKGNDKVYHVIIEERGTTDNKQKWIFEEYKSHYPLFVSYNNIEYLIPYSEK